MSINTLKWMTAVILLVIFITFYTYNPTMDPNDIVTELQEVHDSTMNITDSIYYTNLYEEEITTQKVIYNVLNPLIYTILVEVNTLVPLLVHFAGGTYASVALTLVIIYFVLISLLWLPQIIKAIIMIIFFIRERRLNKEKWWW